MPDTDVDPKKRLLVVISTLSGVCRDSLGCEEKQTQRERKKSMAVTSASDS